MNENDRRILAKACKICLHEKCEHVLIKNNKAQCKICGEWTKVKWDENGFYFPNPTFSTADDWEMVRKEVVVPNQEAFVVFLWSEETWPLNKWIALSCERKCQYAADFIKTSPDLFP